MSVSRDDSLSEKSSGEDTDFLSDKFDAFKALYKKNVVAPFPKIRLFNNLSEYERAMKKPQPETVQTKEKNPATSLAPIRSHKPRSLSTTAAKSDEQSSLPVISRMRNPLDNVVLRMERCVKGPLSLLKRCRDESILVRVWTRNAITVRGICSGYIVAFDKHFNLAMFDVDEILKKPVLPPDKQKKKMCKKKKTMPLPPIQGQSEDQGDEEAASIQSGQDVDKTVASPQGDNNDVIIQGNHKNDSQSIPHQKTDKQKQNTLNLDKLEETDRKVQKQCKDGNEISEQMSHLGVSENRKISALPKDTMSKRNTFDSALYSRRENETQNSQIVHRHVNQLLIRGDNVVLISVAEQRD